MPWSVLAPNERQLDDLGRQGKPGMQSGTAVLSDDEPSQLHDQTCLQVSGVISHVRLIRLKYFS
jgi:hypothetical protein